MAKVTMPQLGESVAEGTIGKWLKQPGDHVAKYEPLVEVVTDKVNAEVPSPFEGTLREILAEEGAVVPNNAEIAIIETADDAGSSAEAPAAPSASDAAARRRLRPPRRLPRTRRPPRLHRRPRLRPRPLPRPPPRHLQPQHRLPPPARPAPTSADRPRWPPRSPLRRPAPTRTPG